MNDPIDTILRHEGGYTANPKDKGNYYKGKLIGTNFGIRAPVLAKWLRRDITQTDMQTLDVATAREIYETEYLTGPRIHTLPEPLRTHLLDISVNRGPGVAIGMLQRVINLAGFGPVDNDNVLGPQTRERALIALEKMGPYLTNAIVDERVKFYNEIVARDPSQAEFIKGWINRAQSFYMDTKSWKP